jgi:histidyl-tRNA synthetase
MQLVRGTHDDLPSERSVYNIITSAFWETTKLYGYQEVIDASELARPELTCQAATPILEYTELFHRSLGLQSDVVSKVGWWQQAKTRVWMG